MARRKVTVRRIDPWSVLRFGLVINLSLTAAVLFGLVVTWVVARQLGVIRRLCEVAVEFGFERCIDGVSLFFPLLLLGVLGAVLFTALLVLASFLYNLVADLVGGVVIGVSDRGVPSAVQRTSPPPSATERGAVSARRGPPGGGMGDARSTTGRLAGRPRPTSRRRPAPGGARGGRPAVPPGRRPRGGSQATRPADRPLSGGSGSSPRPGTGRRASGRPDPSDSGGGPSPRRSAGQVDHRSTPPPRRDRLSDPERGGRD